MAGVSTKHIRQPCTCQPNELKREIKKKTGGAKRGVKQTSEGSMAHPAPPLRIATAYVSLIVLYFVVRLFLRRKFLCEGMLCKVLLMSTALSFS